MSSGFTEIKENLDEQQRLTKEFQELQEARWAKLDAKGFLSAESLEQVTRMSEHLTFLEDRKDDLLATIDRVAGIETTLKRREKSQAVNGKTMTEAEHAYAQDLMSYMRFGDRQVDFDASVGALVAERKAALPANFRDRVDAKALSIGIDPAGGYYVSFEVDAEMTRYQVETSPMDQLATVTTGTAHSLIRRARTARLQSGGWVAETASRPETATPETGVIEMVAHEQYAMPAATQTELEDPEFNSEQWLQQEAADELLIEQNTAFVIGSGNGRPRGFTTYTAGTDFAAQEMQQFNVGNPITAGGVVALQDELLEPFQPNATWTMRRAIKTLIRLFRADEPAVPDSGQFMLIQDFSTRGAIQLLGAPVVLFADMAAAAAGNLILAYGDFRQGYRIYRRRGLSVLRDPFTNKPFVNFYVTQRTGGGSFNTEAIKIGVQT